MPNEDYADVNVPLSAIPRSTTVPTGVYELEIDELEISDSNPGTDKDGNATPSKVMVTPSYHVAKGEHEGVNVYTGPFVLGTNTDPRARDPKTWQSRSNFGAMGFAKLMDAVQVGMDSGNLPQLCSMARGRRFNAMVNENTDTREGPYKGTQRNQIPLSGYLLLGQAPVGNRAVPQPQTRTAFRPGDGPQRSIPGIRVGQPVNDQADDEEESI